MILTRSQKKQQNRQIGCKSEALQIAKTNGLTKLSPNSLAICGTVKRSQNFQ